MYLTGAKIGPVGDSITYGFGDATVVANGAWRYHINDPLATFLKTQPIWKGTMAALGAYKSGQKMLGTSGRRIDEVLTTDNAAVSFLQTTPDMIVVHLGTNDMTQLNSGAWASGSVAISIANMSTLLDYYRTACPKGIAVVCKIMPNTNAPVDTLMTQWCSELETMIAARSDAGYIIIADVNAAFKANPTWSTDYMYDATHPNDAGEQVIASTVMSAISANVTVPARGVPAQRRRTIKPHTGALVYNVSSATSLGSSTMLDSTLPWAVSFDIDMSSDPGATGSSNGILALKTDQATPFVFLTLPGIGGGGRGFEFGSNANFSRFFPANTIDVNVMNRISKGWHQIVVTFDGVSRTTASSYKLYIDGVNIVLASGAGLGATSNVNEIGRVVGGGRAGIFTMADLTIWNGGSAITAAQVADWYFNHKVPTGPTMTHRWEHTDLSGSKLTDSIGSAHGTIGTATWTSSNLPTVSRSSASARTTATTRTLAS